MRRIPCRLLCLNVVEVIPAIELIPENLPISIFIVKFAGRLFNMIINRR
jgi:hypothetical protein